MNAQRSLLDKSVRDGKGQIALAQVPNFPLVIFLVANGLAKVFGSGGPSYAFRALAFSSIFVWGLLELFGGVNYFRRLLGFIVLGLSIMSAVHYVHTLN